MAGSAGAGSGSGYARQHRRQRRKRALASTCSALDGAGALVRNGRAVFALDLRDRTARSIRARSRRTQSEDPVLEPLPLSMTSTITVVSSGRIAVLNG